MTNVKKISLIILITLLAGFAILSWIDLDNSKFIINEDDFFEQQQRIETLKNKLKVARKPNIEYQKDIEIIKQNKNSFWQEERDGRVESNMRSIIKNLASECKFNLKSIGKLRRSQNKLGFVSYEISISGNCSVDAIVKFCQLLTVQEVKFRWINLSITNNYNFSKKVVEKQVMVQGTLAVMELTDEKLVKAIDSKKKLGDKK